MARLVVSGSTIPDVRLVIFDKDGTLMDVHQYWAAMVRFRARMLCDHLGLPDADLLGLMDCMGVNVREMRLKPEGPVGIKKRQVVMHAAVAYLASRGRPDQERLCEEVFAEVDRRSLELFAEIVKPIAGTYPLFEGLLAAGCKIAIATTDLSGRAALAMEHLGLTDKIDYIAGADMVSRSKPHPEIIELILRELAVAPENAVMVGDAVTDVAMGVNAGLKAAIAVLSGISRAAELRQITPILADSVADIEVMGD